jgi:hypothetical protein
VVERAGLSFLFLILGLNGVYFGCIANGSNNRRNPIWQFLYGFVELEKIVVGFVVAAIILYVLYELAYRQKSTDRAAPDFQRNDSVCIHPNYSLEQISIQSSELPGEVLRVESTFGSSNPAILNNENAPGLETNEKAFYEPVPQKPKTTPEELKQMAIQDILGR